MVLTQEPTKSLTALQRPGAADAWIAGGTAGRCPSPDDCAQQLMLDVFAQGEPQGEVLPLSSHGTRHRVSNRPRNPFRYFGTPCRGAVPSYQRRSTWRPFRLREPHQQPESCSPPPRPARARLGWLCLLGWSRVAPRPNSSSGMMIITIRTNMIIIIIIIVSSTSSMVSIDEPMMVVSIACDERL